MYALTSRTIGISTIAALLPVLHTSFWHVVYGVATIFAR
jgi:hypothetical protein